MKYSPGLPQDTHACLENLLWNLAKMLLKSHHGIKCQYQYTKVISSFCTVPIIVNGGDWGCIVRELETIIVLVFLA